MVSCTRESEAAHRLEVLGGRLVVIEESQGRRGTVADVSELFFNYPARRKFLRSASAESGLCRAVFADRAAAHPAVAFRLFSEGEVRLSLLPASPLERIAQAWKQQLDARLLRESAQDGEGFTVRVVAGSPDLRRRDRKLLQCFVNRRRVAEFSLLQAAEFGFAGYIPGGWHPAAFVFVEIDPSLVDFNIHPAKKEVRFRNLPEVHRTVVAAVKKMLEPQAPPSRARTETGGWTAEAAAARTPDAPAGKPVFDLPLAPGATAATPGGGGIRFLGQVFGVFLIFELPGRLLMMDQHAAHERILYERLAARAPAMQEMLFPLCFDVTDDEEARLMAARGELEGIGIGLRRAGASSL